ncbi:MULTISPECIES: ATP-binding protein [unclassified Pseudomonas]|uniref:ATP-binding protein n=1 Tax=unclassified Pseudomonas TaxID=196821 RepID=UPI0023B9FE74|nr:MULTISPECIES: ATP-binding protein [unclassified Pseudomonas]
MKRFWPDSLSGRLVLILVTGLLAAQVLTSSIWYEVRHGQVLEIPTRLLATRLADLILLDRHDPQQAMALIRALQADDFRLLERPPSTSPLDKADRNRETLLREVVEQRTGAAPRLRLLSLEVLDQDGHPASLPVLFGTGPASGRFLVELQLPSGPLLYLQATEEQGWTNTPPLSLLLDYLTRIYLLRIIVVVLIALLAVRLVLRPLQRMTGAAEALGQDIHRPALPVEGPREVRQAAQAFNAMQRRLIDSIAERTRFFAAVSHDLRTPITRLRLRAELLADEATRQRFRDDLQRMEEMVSASLDFLRSGELQDAREQVDIDALLQGLQADFHDLGAEVAIQGSARPLVAHASGLHRCLQNLLENAVRHAGGLIEIQLEDSAEYVRIGIADRGPGIDEALLERVMEPFYREDEARGEGTGGYGLGLSIARQIASAHGGSLTLQPRESGGLLALLDLPRRS